MMKKAIGLDGKTPLEKRISSESGEVKFLCYVRLIMEH